MGSVNYRSMGHRIRFFRKKSKLTQEALSEKADLSQKFLSNIENAKGTPSIETLVKICNALEVTPNQLLMDSVTFSYPERFAEIAATLEGCTPGQLAEINRFIRFIQSGG